MSATNATTNYSLPLFIGTDKPAWLVDWNSAMTDIDSQMKVNATAILANETAISGLSTTVSAHTTSISTISGQISTLTTGLNTAQGNINTINSLIGNGEPTTSDKTLIGAINEIYGMITGGGGTEIQAANVSFDGTASGLSATSVQAAIEEVYAAIPGASTPTAADVSYSNTASGLTATTVQAAIDELAAGAGAPFVVQNVTGITVSVNSNDTLNVTYTKPNTPSGYELVSIGIIEDASYTGTATMFAPLDKSYVNVINHSGASLSTTVDLKLLYVKSAV